MTIRRVARWTAACAAAALLCAALYRYRRVQAATDVPLAPARYGEFLVVLRCRGELRARVSKQLTAPRSVPDLQIVWLAPPGSRVEAGEVVVRFDPSSARQQLQEKEAALRQAQATLDQALAQGRVTAEQDKRDLASSRYDVEKARLEASKQEIVSRLQGEESRIDLKLAEQNLRVEEATVELHRKSDEAKIASLTRVRDQAQADVDLTRQRLAQMELASPLTGVINYLPNYSQGWNNARPFKAGDRAWPGGALAEIPDLATIEMEGKIEEIDRGRINIGNDVRVRIDSFPGKPFPGKLSALSPLTEQNFEWPPTRSFRGFGRLLEPDARLRPGMNGSMDIIVRRLPGAISVPAKAVFTRQGKPVVYVAAANEYRAVEVEVLARNPDEVAVKGLASGVMVALAEPERKENRP